eukprot:945983-Rhodomonas_salina.1
MKDGDKGKEGGKEKEKEAEKQEGASGTRPNQIFSPARSVQSVSGMPLISRCGVAAYAIAYALPGTEEGCASIYGVGPAVFAPDAPRYGGHAVLYVGTAATCGLSAAVNRANANTSTSSAAVYGSSAAVYGSSAA